MTQAYEIPLSPEPQRLRVPLSGTTYGLTVAWNGQMRCWALTIADADGNDLVASAPLVTGLDLMAQYGFLGIGHLVVQTDFAPDDVPTLENLGVTGRLYFVTEP